MHHVMDGASESDQRKNGLNHLGNECSAVDKRKKSSMYVCMYVCMYVHFKKDRQSSKQCYINIKRKSIKPCSFRADGIHVVRGSFFDLMVIGRLSRRECSP